MEERRLRVVIVDDEEITRQFLKKCIDWQCIGMEIVAEAAGGNEALDLIEDVDPDILLTDIQMPFMDGLELSRRVAELYPSIKTVIITAHKDFEYARQSITIGVENFLLKPIDRQELLKIANTLRETIRKEKQHWTEYSQLKMQLAENREYLKEKTLLEILEGNLSRDAMKQRLAYYYSESLPHSLQIALAAPLMAGDSYSEEARLMARLQIVGAAKQLAGKDPIEVLQDNHHRVVLIGLDGVNLVRFCETLKHAVRKATGTLVTIGVSNVYNDIALAARAGREAIEALRFGKLEAPGEVTLYKENLVLNESQWSIPAVDLSEIGFMVKAGQSEKAFDMITVLLNSTGQLPLNQARIASINILSAILGALTELGLNFDGISGEAELPYHQLFDCQDIATMLVCLKQVLHQSTNAVKATRRDKSRKIIDDVQEYLKENLADPTISQTSVAKRFFTNPSYLSRIFKKETGVGFTEYLSKLRMEYAMELIRSTELKAYQIAEKVGVNDAYYFSTCFKKHTGQTVSEYKRMH